MDFFQTTPLRREMLKHTTSFVEQTTRAFFYKGSTWDERIAIVKNHIEYMENIFNDEAIAKLYVNGERIRLWEDTYEEQPLVIMEDSVRKGAFRWCFRWVQTSCTKLCFGWRRHRKIMKCRCG